MRSSTTNKFKVGDRVKLINNYVRHDWNDRLCIGKVYKVTGLHEGPGFYDRDHPTVRLELTFSDGYKFGWWVYIGSVEGIVVIGKQLLFPFMED